MKLTKPMLRNVRVYNDYDYAQGNPYIYYRPVDNGRWYKPAAWIVTKAGVKLVHDAHWQDYGNYVVAVSNRVDKERKLEEVIQWATERFGIKEWEKTPFGTWMDKEFVMKRNKELEKLLHETMSSLPTDKK